MGPLAHDSEQKYYFASFSLVIPSFSNHCSPFTHFLELTYVVETWLIWLWLLMLPTQDFNIVVAMTALNNIQFLETNRIVWSQNLFRRSFVPYFPSLDFAFSWEIQFLAMWFVVFILFYVDTPVIAESKITLLCNTI